MSCICADIVRKMAAANDIGCKAFFWEAILKEKVLDLSPNLYGRPYGLCQAPSCAKKPTDLDHPAHAQSIIQAFALHTVVSKILSANSKGPDHTACMCRLIWVFTVCIGLKTSFLMACGPYIKEQQMYLYLEQALAL